MAVPATGCGWNIAAPDHYAGGNVTRPLKFEGPALLDRPSAVDGSARAHCQGITVRGCPGSCLRLDILAGRASGIDQRAVR